MFYSGLLLRTIVWESASQIALRNCSNKIGEEPGYSFSEKTTKTIMSLNIKILLLIIKNRHIKSTVLVFF